MNRLKSFLGGFLYIDPANIEAAYEQKEFYLPCDTEERYYRKVLTNNGSTATVYMLQYCMHLTADDVVLLPDFLCATVVTALEYCPAKRRYYHVKNDLSIDMEDLKRKLTDDVRVFYVIHYFGVPQPLAEMQELMALSRQRDIYVVEDITQCHYSVAPGRIGVGHYLVGATRKWAPCTDGGLLAARNDAPFRQVDLPDGYDSICYTQVALACLKKSYDDDPSKDIMEYFRYELDCNSVRYLDLTPKKITDMSRKIILGYDHARNKQVRMANYAYLCDLLRGTPHITVMDNCLQEEDTVPFGLLLLVPQRDEFWQYLWKNRVQCQIQWIRPEDVDDCSEAAQYYYDHNIMLQIDQRFEKQHLEQMARIVRAYWER